MGVVNFNCEYCSGGGGGSTEAFFENRAILSCGGQWSATDGEFVGMLSVFNSDADLNNFRFYVFQNNLAATTIQIRFGILDTGYQLLTQGNASFTLVDGSGLFEFPITPISVTQNQYYLVLGYNDRVGGGSLIFNRTNDSLNDAVVAFKVTGLAGALPNDWSVLTRNTTGDVPWAGVRS